MPLTLVVKADEQAARRQREAAAQRILAGISIVRSRAAVKGDCQSVELDGGAGLADLVATRAFIKKGEPCGSPVLPVPLYQMNLATICTVRALLPNAFSGLLKLTLLTVT